MGSWGVDVLLDKYFLNGLFFRANGSNDGPCGGYEGPHNLQVPSRKAEKRMGSAAGEMERELARRATFLGPSLSTHYRSPIIARRGPSPPPCYP